MEEQEKDQRKPSQPSQAELYGLQGNQGQYGQGQYDSDGKPDPNGVQAQQSIPSYENSQSSKNSNAFQAPNYYDDYQNVPGD